MYFRLIYESVPWLVANGRKKEAEEILQRAARFNKLNLNGSFLVGVDDPDVSQSTVNTKDDTSKEDLVEAFKHRQNRGKRSLKSLFPCVQEQKQKLETQYTLMDICRSEILIVYSVAMCILWYETITCNQKIKLKIVTMCVTQY